MKKLLLCIDKENYKSSWFKFLIHRLANEDLVKIKKIYVIQKTSHITFQNTIIYLLLKFIYIVEKRFLKFRKKNQKIICEESYKKFDYEHLNYKNIEEELNKLRIDDNYLLCNISKFNLDFEILKNFKGSISLNFAQYLENANMCGFKESLFSYPSTKVELKLLDRNYKVYRESVSFNTFPIWLQNREYALSKITSLIVKLMKTENMKNIFKTPNHINLDEFNILSHHLVYYIFKTYTHILLKKIKEAFPLKLIFAKRLGWHIAILNGNLRNFDTNKMQITKSPRNEFWADPFIVCKGDIEYIFFERYDYRKKKGFIAYGIIKNKKLTYVKDILNKESHLSYPYLFEDNNDFFMIPENHQEKKLEIYKVKQFPDKWVLHATVFNGLSMVDTSIIKDKNNHYWIFTNISYDDFDDFTTELHIFRTSNMKFDDLKPHKLNPVLIGNINSRNAGTIYYDADGNLIRPSQSYEGSIYGKALNISQVVNLTLDSYEEKLIKRINFDNDKNIYGVHHLSHIKNKYVFDILMNSK